MALVVDASIAAAWILPDESSDATDALLGKVASDRALAPDLLWHDLRNIFLMAARRGRLPEAEIAPSLLRLRRLRIDTVAISGMSDAALIALAARHRLTAYDAAYLALAVGNGAVLATADRELRRAAEAEGVELVEGLSY